jgi:hypothetical protein
MYHYFDSVFKAAGQVVTIAPDAIVTVFDADTTNLAAIYSDNGVTLKSNPFPVDRTTGSFDFYAADGLYDIRISGAGINTATLQNVRLEDPTEPSDAVFSNVEIENLDVTGSGQGPGNSPFVTDADLSASAGSSLVGFLQSGTGAVARTVQDELRERISVTQFGADPTGVIDSTDAFNKFFAVIRSKVFSASPATTIEEGRVLATIPPGRYLCTGSINATVIRGMGWTVLAHGATIYSKAAGKAALDLLGSRWGTFLGLRILGDNVDTPRTGWQIGRIISATNNCDNMQFDRCRTDGWFTLAGFYSLASETDAHTHPEYYNNDTSSLSYCYIADGNNYWEATSDFVTPLSGITAMSNIQHTFISADMRKRFGGPTFAMSRCNQLKFVGGYMVSINDAGIVFHDDGTSFSDICLDVHMETSAMLHSVRFERQPSSGTTVTVVTGFELKDHIPQASDSIFKVSSDLTEVRLIGADICIAGSLAPTNKLTAETSKLRIYGRATLPTNLVTPIRMHGELFTYAISSVGQFGPGNYIIHDRNTGVTLFKGDVAQVWGTNDSPTGATISSNPVTLSRSMTKLPSLSAAPTTPAIGFAVDNGSNWSGVNASGAPRPVFYDGSAWRAIV